jgi:hypothetical protein
MREAARSFWTALTLKGLIGSKFILVCLAAVLYNCNGSNHISTNQNKQDRGSSSHAIATDGGQSYKQGPAIEHTYRLCDDVDSSIPPDTKGLSGPYSVVVVIARFSDGQDRFGNGVIVDSKELVDALGHSAKVLTCCDLVQENSVPSAGILVGVLGYSVKPVAPSDARWEGYREYPARLVRCDPIRHLALLELQDLVPLRSVGLEQQGLVFGSHVWCSVVPLGKLTCCVGWHAHLRKGQAGTSAFGGDDKLIGIYCRGLGAGFDGAVRGFYESASEIQEFFRLVIEDL